MLKKEKFVKVCPQCGSSNVRAPGPAAYQKEMSLFVECLDCGFSSPLFPEFPEDKTGEAESAIRAKKLFLQVCPKCGSDRVLNHMSDFGPFVKCLDCLNVQHSFPEFPPEKIGQV